MVRPSANSIAHQLPLTTWLSSARTSHPSHGVASPSWSGLMAPTTLPVASSARRWTAAMSTVMSSTLHIGELLGHLPAADAEHVDAADVAPVPRVAPQLHDPLAGR